MTIKPSICIFACILFLSMFTGCKKKAEINVELSPSAQIKTQNPLPTPTIEQTAEPNPFAAVEVTQSKAMYFPNLQPLPMLYAAIEVKNTGTTPACVSDIAVKFNTGAYRVDGEFTPMLYRDDVILPGATAAYALWQKYDKEPELRADSQIKVSCEIKFEPADADRTPRKLDPSNVRLEDNYPGFSTITGSVKNPSKENSYSLSLFYAAFYDENDELIAVWHFSENIAIATDESRNFVSHLKALPISGLSSKVKRIDARCIGID